MPAIAVLHRRRRAVHLLASVNLPAILTPRQKNPRARTPVVAVAGGHRAPSGLRLEFRVESVLRRPMPRQSPPIDRQFPPSFLPHRFPPSIYPIPTQTDKPSTERWSKEGLAGRSFACISIRPKRVRRVVGSNTAVNSRPLCIQRRCRPAPSTHGNGSGTTDPDAISGRPRARRS